MQATNAAGQVIHFNPTRINLISGPRPTDENQVFYLHGVCPPPIPELAGSITEFIATLPNAENFIPVTLAQTGLTIYINAVAVRSINPVPANIQSQRVGANAIIGVGKRNRFVTESVADVQAAVHAAGGPL